MPEISEKLSEKRRRRPGAGRPKKLATILKEIAIKNWNLEAEASMSFWVSVRDDARESMGFRLEASRLLYEHIRGKPKNAVNLDGNMKLSLEELLGIATNERQEIDGLKSPISTGKSTEHL